MTEEAVDRLRIDKWLWHARFFKSRTLAAKRVTAGGLRVNRKIVKKPNHPVQTGDVLTFATGPRVRVVKIAALGERRGPAPEARLLYEDLTPPAVQAAADAPSQKTPSREPGAGRPTKKDRRAVERLKSDGDWS
ncbi:MAG: RNA-binding S4 domain-containing protein [Alphaproteobacteria bacterium]|nr:RNA-binding S4 domain-containing protein [Alphaproteobacteria bacterium]